LELEEINTKKHTINDHLNIEKNFLV